MVVVVAAAPGAGDCFQVAMPSTTKYMAAGGMDEG